MIREVKPDDAADIVTIYNRYIAETTVTFETVKLSTVQMQQRIKEISHTSLTTSTRQKGK